MSDSDSEIRENFAELRAEDRMTAPAFSAILIDVERRATTPAAPWISYRMWWVVAAASAIVTATLLTQHARRSEPADEVRIGGDSMYSSILSWGSPTDGLLRSSQQTAVPQISTFGSVFDGMTIPVIQPDSSKGGGS